jgi:hypothetical protein
LLFYLNFVKVNEANPFEQFLLKEYIELLFLIY